MFLTKRLFHWFHNNTRPNSALSKQDVIPVKKSAKRLAVWQAYQKIYWVKLKPIVDEAYKAHLNTLAKGEKAKPKIQIQTEVVRGEYAKEAEDVKAEVEKYMHKSSEEEGDENCAEKFQQWVFSWSATGWWHLKWLFSGVDRVSRSLATYMRTLEEASGWRFCVLAGGPNPRQDGRINTVLWVQSNLYKAQNDTHLIW